MLKIDNIKISTREKNQNNAIANKICSLCHVSNISDLIIIKKSIDARKKPDLFYVYSIGFNVDNAYIAKLLNNKKLNISKYEPKTYEYITINKEPLFRPIIVGTGPAGLFAGYSLINSGFKPIFIERGQDIDNRTSDVNQFWKNGILNENSNVQFGEGGAGTFSDGKLNTGVKDPFGFNKEVLRTFVKFGAPEDILYASKPHIGTDILKTVIKNMRFYMISKGAEFLFNTCFIDFESSNNHVSHVTVRDENNKIKNIDTNMLILALGHSSRDTFLMLKSKNVVMENKPFAVGFRVIHPQNAINISQYGDGNENMPAADYKVTYNAPDGKGVYSFCMCPGGFVVNASSENGYTCVNGMSYHDRDSGFANSAIVMTIDESDYGSYLLDGMYYQRKLEKDVYNLANGKLCVQRFGDFKQNKRSNQISEDNLAIKGEYVFGDVSQIFNDQMKKNFISGMEHFGKIIKGFDSDDTLIIPVEARTSSPIRILRDEQFESSVKGIYPIGEGAGYAGGITSAAMDGLKVAKNIALRYNSIGFKA